MPYRKEQFINGEIYHIVSRGIDENLIFKDINDYYRGVFSIYEFNNDKPTEIWERRRARLIIKKQEKITQNVGGPTSHILEDRRDKFVEILAFCFMPNHIHLLLKQVKEGGITKFMAKFGGYGRYFNKKYNRKGYVFQNRFESIRVVDDNQFKIVVTYIFTNPIALIEPGFKEKGIKSLNKVRNFLENYKWSSYPDCIGKKNFPSVTDRKFLLEVMGGEQGCKEAVENWIKHKEEIGKFPETFLD